MLINNYVILITGGAGFIGANLTRRLVDKNKIHLFLKPTTNLWRLKDIISKLTIHNQDLTDFKNLTKTVHKIKPDIIYHLATHGAYSTQTDPIQMINTNLKTTANLILALDEIDYKCFVNTGSSSEYGFKTKPMKEDDLLEPNSFYAATKASGTYLCQVLARSQKKPIITFRPFSVYGPYEEGTRLIPTVILNILHNQPVKLTVNLAKRDFIYVEDLIDCYLLLAKKINKKIYGEVYNAGTGKQYSNGEIVETIKNLTKKKVKILKGAYQNRTWDTSFWVADISKITKDIGWKPKYTLEKGLEKTINWFKQNERLYLK